MIQHEGVPGPWQQIITNYPHSVSRHWRGSGWANTSWLATPAPDPAPTHHPAASRKKGSLGGGLACNSIFYLVCCFGPHKNIHRNYADPLVQDRPARMLILTHSSFPWGKEKSFFGNKLWYNILILLHDLLMINIQNMSRILCFYPLRSHLCAIWASNINKTVGAAINWL